MKTTRPTPAGDDTEALRADLDRTRHHLAHTVQELSRQLDVPHRLKETAGDAGHRARRMAGDAGQRARHLPGTAADLSRRHPRAAAGGAAALAMGAAAWVVGRSR
jgi:hypothetical protein